SVIGSLRRSLQALQTRTARRVRTTSRVVMWCGNGHGPEREKSRNRRTSRRWSLTAAHYEWQAGTPALPSGQGVERRRRCRSAARERSEPAGSAELGEAAVQQPAFRLEPDERQRRPIGVRGFVATSQATQQVGTCGRQQMIKIKRATRGQRIEQVEGASR